MLEPSFGLLISARGTQPLTRLILGGQVVKDAEGQG
jgi:hypothetical protein